MREMEEDSSLTYGAAEPAPSTAGMDAQEEIARLEAVYKILKPMGKYELARVLRYLSDRLYAEIVQVTPVDAALSPDWG